MNIIFVFAMVFIFVIYILKNNIENFKSKTWGFGMFEIPFFSITMDEDD